MGVGTAGTICLWIPGVLLFNMFRKRKLEVKGGADEVTATSQGSTTEGGSRESEYAMTPNFGSHEGEYALTPGYVTKGD